MTTSPETAAIDRIPITRSVSYAVRDAPELPAHGATIPGTTLAPTQITFTYQAAPDSQLGRIQARVKGFWMRDGGRVNPGQPMAQHYFDGLTDWPGWLAEEARLHDPEAAVSVPPPATRADNQAALRQRIAEALIAWTYRGKNPEHGGILETVRANAYSRADAVLAVLPEPTDRAAVLREAADCLADEIMRGAHFGHEDARQPGLAEAVELLRRLAAEGPITAKPETEADELLALATVLEIPRPGTGIPLQLRLIHGHGDRWAICDRTGRRWHREYGWVHEPDGIRSDEHLHDATRYTFAEAVPLAREIAAGVRQDGAQQ